MDSLELCRKYKEDEYIERVSRIIKLNYISGISGENIVISLTDNVQKLLNKVSSDLFNSTFNLSTEDILDEVISSARIEGSNATIESVKCCIDSEYKSKSDMMALNILDAQRVYGNKRVISLKDIVGMWRVLSRDVCENMSKQGIMFRSGMVYIGDGFNVTHVPEKPERIQDKMESLVKFLNCSNVGVILKGIVCHYYIEYIHPMCDGNGRLGRLLQNIVIGNSIYISSIVNANIKGYYRAIKDSNLPCNVCGLGMCLDVGPFVEYILLCMSMAIDEFNKTTYQR